jgi:hypothetical protein
MNASASSAAMASQSISTNVERRSGISNYPRR